MVYSCLHEASNLCTGTVEKGARTARSRAAIQGRLRDASLPDPSGQSARGESPPKIAQSLGCASQTVRNAIRAFNERGLDALLAGSSRPKRVHAAFDEKSAESLREMLHRSAREFSGAPRVFGLWRWPPMSPSRRGSPKSASPERRFGRRSGACFRFGGCGPSGGSPPPTPYTKEKKAARPADGDLCLRSAVGHRIRGRVLV